MTFELNKFWLKSLRNKLASPPYKKNDTSTRKDERKVITLVFLKYEGGSNYHIIYIIVRKINYT